MSADMPNQDIHLIRDDLEGYPRHPFPAGYHLRPYRMGDEARWTGIQQAAEPFLDIADSLFRDQFGHDEAVLADRVGMVENGDGEAVGVIAAWWQDDWLGRGEWGQIHWVAVHPDHQRRGLSKPMMTWAMERLRRSHSRAFLGTSSGRVWAIKVYLDFGFRPDPREMQRDEVAAAWIALQERLHHPTLTRTLAGI